jgi:tetratricopeptide (TPR) repeat protein
LNSNLRTFETMHRLLLILILLTGLPVAATEPLPGESRDYLEGRRRYDAGDFKGAVAAFERAAARDPEDDRAVYWLGKACGRVAERAGPLAAMKWAGRTRDALERAVEINPDNPDAVYSLAQFYEEAPRFIGGNAKKARELRRHLERLRARTAPAPAAAPAPN